MTNWFSLDGFARLARSRGMNRALACPGARRLGVILAGVLLVLATPTLAQTDSTQIDSLASTTAGPVLPDPVPGQGGNFSPSAVTSGQAYGGPPLGAPSQNCSPFNPCALASSDPHRMAPPLTQ